MEVSELHRTV
jgi:hypothetical protein